MRRIRHPSAKNVVTDTLALSIDFATAVVFTCATAKTVLTNLTAFLTRATTTAEIVDVRGAPRSR